MKKIIATEAQEIDKEAKRQIENEFLTKKEKQKGFKNLKKLLPFYGKYRKTFIVLCLTVISFSVLSLIAPVITGEIFDSLSMQKFDDVIRFSLIFMIIEMVSNFISYLSCYIRSKIEFGVKFDLRQNLVDNIDRITMKSFDKANTSVFLTRISKDSEKCSSVILNLVNKVMFLIESVCFAIYIAFINIWLFVLMVVYVFVMWIVDNFRLKYWFKKYKYIKSIDEISINSYYEQVRGIKDLKTLNMRENLLAVSGNKYKYVTNYEKNVVNKYDAMTLFGKGYVRIIFEFLLIFVGVLLIKSNIVSFAGFMVVYLYKSKVTGFSRGVTELREMLSDAELSAQRYFEIVENFEKDSFGTIENNVLSGEMDIKKIYFGYDSENFILKGLDLKIERNKMTAIVGKSGSGKSTLLNLISKLYSPQKGHIYLDGVDIDELTEKSIRNAIGVVNQNPYIFNTTIRNNLKYVKPDATEEEMWDVLKKAQIYDFVKSQEQKLDCYVGENGVQLSGGQKQRLAIARILLKGSKIIVFDEATSALDNTSQAKIVSELEKLKNDHTIIVVAHRLSTIVNADNIVVLDNGKIVNQGTHTYLLKNCKEYNELYSEEYDNK